MPGQTQPLMHAAGTGNSKSIRRNVSVIPLV